jgi:hypothetical protein
MNVTRHCIALSCGLTLAALLVAGCGGTKSGNGGSDAVVEARGVVSMRGSSPFPFVFLQTGTGTGFVIEASDIGDELRQLEGMEVSVFGRVLPDIEGETPMLRVEDYDLVRLPSGERPLIGVIGAGSLTNEVDTQVWLRDKSEKVWLIEGDFASLLLGFPGAKVWVVGVAKPTSSPGGRTYQTLIVTEYGVIRQ